MTDFQFPPMTDFEKTIMTEWSETNLTLISLINILSNKINTADGHTFVDKIENMPFTKINNSLYKNVFVQIITLRSCYHLDLKDGANTMSPTIKNKLIQSWNQFLQQYTPL